MGDCRYCGKSAGFLRRQHKECADRHERALGSMRELCVDAALRGAGLDALPDRVRDAAATAGIVLSDAEMSRTLAEGWRGAVEAAMEDHSLSTDEKRGLNLYRRRFGLGERELDESGHFELFRMMTLLRSLVDEGVIPRYDRKAARAKFGRLPFNLMKSEELMWVFPDVEYREQVTRREYQGSSMGMSFKVAKGVYVRPGTFKGRAVDSTSMEHTDTGLLGVTTKHIYFKGAVKGFRVRLEKIVSFDPYKDGVGIMRDTARAKPEAFGMGASNAWFLVNVIEGILDMDDVALPKSGAPSLEDLVEEEPGDEEDGGLFIAGAGASA